MRSLPRDPRPDSTWALVREPYDFVSRRCQRYGSDAFQARILLRRTVCLMGREAAELVYDPQRFERRGVAPGRIQKTLFGRGGVQGLDDHPHRHRKQIFLALMDRQRVEQLGDQTAESLRRAARHWAASDQIVLYRQLQRVLCRTACDWSGVPLPEPEVEQRTVELTQLFDQAGAVGPKHWQARRARHRANRWAVEIIERVRRGELEPPRTTAAHLVAWHRDLHNDLLPPHIAAVELLNVLRPIVATSVYLTFAALAVHQYPEYRERLEQQDPAYEEAFAQEIRRYYPFFPFIAARVRQPFDWHGYHFPRGRRVILDLYGTNHDRRVWEAPQEFRPERFLGREPDAYQFIPQGGGDPQRHHRCPGEPVTMELIGVMLRFLVGQISYEVPEQDLEVDRARIPALPRSGMILRRVRTAEHPATV